MRWRPGPVALRCGKARFTQPGDAQNAPATDAEPNDMRISRDWATPLTIATFALMGVTGVLMFFHLDTGFNKLAHEWLGWVMVAGVALHAVANWAAFKRHLLGSRRGQVIVALGLALTAASFVPQPARPGGGSPPQLAMRTLLDAPLQHLAPLAGQSPEALVARLRAAGYAQADVGSTLGDLAGHQREREAQLLRLVFSPAQAS